MQHQPDADVEAEIARIRSLALDELRTLWRTTFRSAPPAGFTKDLLGRAAYRIQEKAYGGLDRATLKQIEGWARGNGSRAQLHQRLKSGTVMVREYQGERHTVIHHAVHGNRDAAFTHQFRNRDFPEIPPKRPPVRAFSRVNWARRDAEQEILPWELRVCLRHPESNFPALARPRAGDEFAKKETGSRQLKARRKRQRGLAAVPVVGPKNGPLWRS